MIRPAAAAAFFLAGCASLAPLHKAAEQGDLADLRARLDRGEDINAPNPDVYAHNWTPLMVAAYEGRTDAVKLLLDRGADVDRDDGNGQTAESVALLHGHRQIATMLQDARRSRAGSQPPAAAAAAAAAAPAGRTSGVLAVLEFHQKMAQAKQEGVDAAYFTNRVRAAALRALPELRVITRENLLVLLEASGKKIEECEGECEVDTGRRVGADLVISGDLLKIGALYKLDLRLHDTHEGRLIAGAVDSAQTVEQLDSGVTAAVDELLRPLR